MINLPPNTKAFRWLSIKSRVKGFLRVRINIILGWFFKNTPYFNSVLLLFLSFSKCIFKIDTTANGVDLINIANPNPVGVSFKHHKKVNVGKQGAILNISKVTGTSSIILTLKNLIGESKIPV
jgi:hypothetical protein